MENIVSIKDLKKSYGGEVVLDVPELHLTPGESVGLVGNNGAGKTTLFRCILDLIKPDEGAVYSKGENVAQSENWKQYTGSYLDEGFLIDYLTADEYFRFIAKLHGVPQEELEKLLSNYEELFKGEIRGKKKYIRDLSKGNQKKVGVVGALIGNPDLLMLDEPFANLDPSTQFQLREDLHQLDQDTELTMFVSSHDLLHVTEFCQRIIILDHGKIVKDIKTNSETLGELEAFFKKKIRGEQSAEQTQG